jgi:hypothetical protein
MYKGRIRLFGCVWNHDVSAGRTIWPDPSPLDFFLSALKKKKLSSVAWVRERTIYRPSDRCLLAKLVPTFTDRGCDVVSVTDPYGRILGFLDRSRYFSFQAAPQLYSRGWVDPVPDPLLRKSGSAGNWTRIYIYLLQTLGNNNDNKLVPTFYWFWRILLKIATRSTRVHWSGSATVIARVNIPSTINSNSQNAEIY